MSVQFKRATRTQKKLRMALMGPSGSGKTYTALILAAELGKGGKVALLDTERGSASLYSDNFEFDACQLESFNPQHYIDGINAAAAAGYTVLVIDSLSHAWNGEGGVLDQVNKRGGNQFTDGWGKVGTPLQNSLMKAILEAPMHVIATMRVKTEYVVEQNERGKSAPKRVGLAAVQRDGVEYEFDIIGTLDIQNTLTIEKTRMTALAGTIINKPDAKLAQKIMAWLSDGAPAPPSSAAPTNTSPATVQQPTATSPVKEDLREKRGQGIAAMNLVALNGERFNVKTPATSGVQKTFEVWRDDKGKVHCTCLEYVEQSKADIRFRCEHIIAVKHWLATENSKTATPQVENPIPAEAQTNDPELAKDLETQAQLTALYTEAEWTAAAFADWLATEYHGMSLNELSAEQALEVIEKFKIAIAETVF